MRRNENRNRSRRNKKIRRKWLKKRMSRRRDKEEGTVGKNLKGQENMDEGYKEKRGERME